MKQILKIASISSFLLVGWSINIVAQVAGTLDSIQSPLIEVRKGSLIQYTADAFHTSGEEYSWEIVGGTPSPAPISGLGTLAQPYIINFTPNLHTISVTWNTDSNPTDSIYGRVRVQKRSSVGCYTAIRSQVVNAWSPATASITSSAPTDPFCNGSNLGLSVTVAFTGASNFDIGYNVVSTLSGTTVTTPGTISNITGSTATITIPNNLLNSTNVDQTYSIVLTRMNDTFENDGTIGSSNTYTITVRPAESIGTISVSPSSSTLRRR